MNPYRIAHTALLQYRPQQLSSGKYDPNDGISVCTLGAISAVAFGTAAYDWRYFEVYGYLGLPIVTPIGDEIYSANDGFGEYPYYLRNSEGTKKLRYLYMLDWLEQMATDYDNMTCTTKEDEPGTEVVPPMPVEELVGA